MKKLLLFLIFLVPFDVFAFDTNAKGAVLMDTDSNRVLFASNAHYTQSVASISKVMTAVVVLENIDIDKVVVVGDEISLAYGSGIYVKQGERISVEDLLYGLMLRSGNDAALVLAKNVAGSVDEFVSLMNDKARDLGMDDTVFNNPSGLDEKDGNFSSAYDMAILMSYAMQNKVFREIVGTKDHKVKTNLNVYNWHNKNKLLSSYRYCNGGKTGFTKKAKRTLITTASKDGLNLTAVTINDGSDWSDHVSLYDEAFDKYSSYTFVDKGDVSVLGESFYKNDTLYLKKDFKYPLLDGEKETVVLKYKFVKNRSYNDGDRVGTVNLYIGDKKVNSQDIFVNKGKSEGQTIYQRIKLWFKHDK